MSGRLPERLGGVWFDLVRQTRKKNPWKWGRGPDRGPVCSLSLFMAPNHGFAHSEVNGSLWCKQCTCSAKVGEHGSISTFILGHNFCHAYIICFMTFVTPQKLHPIKTFHTQKFHFDDGKWIFTIAIKCVRDFQLCWVAPICNVKERCQKKARKLT